MLYVQEFIKEHSDWKELLSQKPYCLKIAEKDDLVCLKYNQIESDFSEPIVCECRGLILEKDTWNVAALAFKKFFNFGEKYASQIDWNNAVVTVKEDGSLMKLFYHGGEWRIATNGMIDAYDAELNSPLYKNFGELFDAAAQNSGLNYDELDTNCTYVFELCSIFNMIVVRYNEPKLYHLITRNNITLEEIEVNIGVEKPRQYALTSLEDCISLVSTFGVQQEGLVAKDKWGDRVKIKGEEYVRAHRMVNNRSVSVERVLDIIQLNEQSEFLSYFPEYEELFAKVKKAYNSFREEIHYNIALARHEKTLTETRKEFAEIAKRQRYSFIWFNAYNNPDFTAEAWIKTLRTEKLAQYLQEFGV